MVCGITGGSSTKSVIYTTNANQSTTGNAYGVYDMSGGEIERTASYVNYGSGSNNLSVAGGIEEGDLYGKTKEEQSTSTKYKTVYEASGTSESNSYNLAAGRKGDAVYEISNQYLSSTGSWFRAYSNFPNTSRPFFYRGGNDIKSSVGVFYFNYSDGSLNSTSSFHVVLVE